MARALDLSGAASWVQYRTEPYKRLAVRSLIDQFALRNRNEH